MMCRRLVCMLLALCMVMCSGITWAEDTAEQPRTLSVLFIGNSYTYFNTMPTMDFKKLGESLGYELEVNAITKGSYKLSQFADPEDPQGARVEAALTGDEK